MKKIIMLAAVFAFLLITFSFVHAGDYTGKKVLYVDSYHADYAWSAGITNGIEKVLKDSGIDLKIVRMDTKRNKSEDFKKNAALKAKDEIESYGPDVVIVSDDNAAKYLIVPYYMNSDLPFVFCGVNWDASEYGFPCKNVTGMVEVASIPELVERLELISKGKKIGYLAADVPTAKKEAQNYKSVFDITLEERYVSDFAAWKNEFKDIQKKVDFLIVGNNAGINDWNENQAAIFAEENTQVPTGAIYDFMSPYTMLVYGKVAEEQGEWAADAALKILDGKAPTDIPIAKNKKGQLIINAKIMEHVGAQIPYELLEAAEKIIE